MVEDKCEKCKFRDILIKATEEANQSKAYYDSQVKKVNETISKYTKKIEELDK